MKFGVSLLEYGATLKQDEILYALNRASNFNTDSLSLIITRSPKAREGLKRRLELPSSPMSSPSKAPRQSTQTIHNSDHGITNH